MSDDLVKRYSSYNIMMLGDSGNEVSTPDGEWVKYKDYKAQSARIEELEGKLSKSEALLAKALEALEFIDDTISWEINPSNYGHDEVCDMNRDWGEIGNYAEATLAALKGATDE